MDSHMSRCQITCFKIMETLIGHHIIYRLWSPNILSKSIIRLNNYKNTIHDPIHQLMD